VNAAVIEEGRAVPVDEIDVARDLAAVEEAAALLRAERVLPAEEAAVAKRRAIPGDVNRQSLPVIAGGVFEGDVLGDEIGRVDQRAATAGGADFFARCILGLGVEVPSEDRSRRVITSKGDAGSVKRDDDFFLVRPGLDVNGDALPVVRGNRVNRSLNRSVIAAAVGGDRQRADAGRLTIAPPHPARASGERGDDQAASKYGERGPAAHRTGSNGVPGGFSSAAAMGSFKRTGSSARL
jgi:hypothetical protein